MLVFYVQVNALIYDRIGYYIFYYIHGSFHEVEYDLLKTILTGVIVSGLFAFAYYYATETTGSSFKRIFLFFTFLLASLWLSAYFPIRLFTSSLSEK